MSAKILLVIGGLVCGSAINSVFGADLCDPLVAKLNATDRDLIYLPRHHILQSAEQLFDKRTESIRLGYMVPQTPFPTGVFIVKARHKILTTRPVGPSFIRVERHAYTSPCTQQNVISYGDDVSTERYIDYHFYGFRDSEPPSSVRNLERAHADLGRRDRGCVNTRDERIRGHFLYGDDRQIAGFWEKVGRQKTLVFRALGTQTAFAEPTAYSAYNSLRTEVISYRKSLPDRPACFAFNLPIPAHTVQTEVMIIDADDALSSWMGGPQKSWTLTWPIARSSGTLAGR